MACLEQAITLGGHVRVGFENAIVDAHGRLAQDNAERVSIVAGMARSAGRRLATASDARSILGVARSSATVPIACDEGPSGPGVATAGPLALAIKRGP